MADPFIDWVHANNFGYSQSGGKINLDERSVRTLFDKYQRAVWFLQDIANMSKKVGSETAAHALAQLGEKRERDGD